MSAFIYFLKYLPEPGIEQLKMKKIKKTLNLIALIGRANDKDNISPINLQLKTSMNGIE